MKKTRGRLLVEPTRARRHPACLPRAELPEAGGGRNGTKI